MPATSTDLQAEFRARLHDGVSGLFNNKMHADLTLSITGHELPAHSTILAIQSEYFNAALRHNLIENQTRKFHFEKDSPYTLWRSFEFAYTGGYSEKIEELSGPDDDELVKAIKVYVLGDYFKIRGLQEYALKRQKERLQIEWEQLDFVNCIREVYGTTEDSSDQMRALISSVAYQHLDQLWRSESFRQLIQEGGDFSVDIVGMTASPSSPLMPAPLW